MKLALMHRHAAMKISRGPRKSLGLRNLGVVGIKEILEAHNDERRHASEKERLAQFDCVCSWLSAHFE